MSYDILIAADPLETVPVEEIHSLLHRFPEVSGDGSFLVAEDEAGEIHIEIDLELATEEGDTLDDPTGMANQVLLHVPYPTFEASKDLALEIAVTVADGLDWQAWDEQSGEELTAETATLDATGEAVGFYESVTVGLPQTPSVGVGFWGMVVILAVACLLIWRVVTR